MDAATHAVALGWGTKQGSRVPSWKQRFFSINRADDNPKHWTLQYFEKDTGRAAPKGSVRVATGSESVTVVERKIGGTLRQCLRIETTSLDEDAGVSKRRVLLVSPDTVHPALLAWLTAHSPTPTVPKANVMSGDPPDTGEAAVIEAWRLILSCNPGESGPTGRSESAAAPNTSGNTPENLSPPDPDVDVGAQQTPASDSGAGGSTPRLKPLSGTHGPTEPLPIYESHHPPTRIRSEAATEQEQIAYIREKVDRQIARIQAETPELLGQWAHIRSEGAMPCQPQGTTTAEALDAVGALYCGVTSLETQIAETRTKLADGGWKLDAEYVTEILAPIKTALAREKRQLAGARAAATRWNLDLSRLTLKLPSTPEETTALCGKLPLAATDPRLGGAFPPSELTVQRLLGVCVLQGLADRAEAALRAYTARRAAATAGLVASIFADIDSYAEVYDAILADPTEAAAVHALEDLSQAHGRGLDHVNHPEEAAFEEAASVTEIVEVHDGVVATIGGGEVPPRTQAEHAVFRRALGANGSITLYNLVCTIVHGAVNPPPPAPGDDSGNGQPKECPAASQHSKAASDTASTSTIDQRESGSGPDCATNAPRTHMSSGTAAFVVPGGIKALSRIVYKTATKYRCDFGRCADVIRCTVVTTTFAAATAVVRAVLSTPSLTVVRVKNRFARGFDSQPIGGYRDYQMIVLFPESGGMLLGEIQINLEQFMAIKARPDGGHAVFKFARSLAAFDAKTYTYSGPCSADVCAQMASGQLLRVDMREAKLGEGGWATRLADALLSPKCRVTDLNVTVNGLGPDGISTVARALEANTSLKVIKLNANEAGEVGCVAVAQALKVNRTLTTVTVRRNTMGDQGVDVLAEALRENDTLDTLDLGDCQISGASAKPLAAVLSTNTTLTSLTLSWNDLGEEGALAFAPALKDNTTLTFICFEGNFMGTKGGKAIAEALKVNNTLKTIDLNWNGLEPEGGTAVADAIANNTGLTELMIMANNIGPDGGRALGAAFESNKTLQILTMGSNAFGPDGCAAIASALATNSVITHVRLSMNEVGPEGAEALAEMLKTNSTLKELRLNSNECGPRGGEAIARALHTNVALTDLSLISNQLGVGGGIAIAAALKVNKTLRNLNLWDNDFEASNGNAFAEALKVNRTLKVIDLGNNRLTTDGAIAIALALQENAGLVNVDLQNNGVGSGAATAIRAALAENTRLRSFKLGGNELGEDFVADLTQICGGRDVATAN